MSQIKITINTENAAFDDDMYGQIADILESIAIDARENKSFQDFVWDVNGNKCGLVEVTK